MNTKLLALSTMATAVIVSGCSTTSPTPPPPPPPPSPLNYTALAIDGSPTVRQTNGTIGGSPSNVEVQVDGRTYNFGGGSYVDTVGSIDVYEYLASTPGVPGEAALMVGDHARATILADDVNQMRYLVLDGNRTPYDNMPTQLAGYEGLWVLSSMDGRAEGGVFDAGVNFGDGSVAIDLYDGAGSIPMGAGSGAVQGTGFIGTIATQGALPSNNGIDGQFYGPNAEEMAGLIQGKTTDNNSTTAGMLIGSQ